VLLNLSRSVIMSERTALIEAVCLLWVYARISNLKLKASVIIGWAFGLMLLFALILQVRLSVQSELGSAIRPSETTLVQSLAAYYADTTNKYYQALDGTLKYPHTTAFVPFVSLIEGRRRSIDEYGDYLAALEGFSPFVISGLNNSGGLAEDISDFGLFGFLVVAAKFFAFGFLLTRSGRTYLGAALSVLVLMAVLEYPRFNYFNMPFAAYLAFLAVCLALLMRIGFRSVARVPSTERQALHRRSG
jgi:hypothetical protein